MERAHRLGRGGRTRLEIVARKILSFVIAHEISLPTASTVPLEHELDCILFRISVKGCQPNRSLNRCDISADDLILNISRYLREGTTIDFKFHTIFREIIRKIRSLMGAHLISLRGRTILRELFLQKKKRKIIDTEPSFRAHTHKRIREFYVGVKLAKTHACVPFRSINVFRLDFRLFGIR